MLRRPLIIRTRLPLIVLLVCVAYWVVAAMTEFPPLTPYSTFNQRVGECAAIWTLLCAGYLGIATLRGCPGYCRPSVRAYRSSQRPPPA